jgi:hypothetical protein
MHNLQCVPYVCFYKYLWSLLCHLLYVGEFLQSWLLVLVDKNTSDCFVSVVFMFWLSQEHFIGTNDRIYISVCLRKFCMCLEYYTKFQISQKYVVGEWHKSSIAIYATKWFSLYQLGWGIVQERLINTTRNWERSQTERTLAQPNLYFQPLHISTGARGSVVVKALCYKLRGHWFEIRWGEFLNLPDLSGHSRSWGLLSL